MRGSRSLSGRARGPLPGDAADAAACDGEDQQATAIAISRKIDPIKAPKKGKAKPNRSTPLLLASFICPGSPSFPGVSSFPFKDVPPPLPLLVLRAPCLALLLHARMPRGAVRFWRHAILQYVYLPRA